MGSFSIWHWLILLVVVMLLFGGNKVSGLMGDFAKGIKSFKKNMADDHDVSMEASAEKPTGSAPLASSRRSSASRARHTASSAISPSRAQGLGAQVSPLMNR